MVKGYDANHAFKILTGDILGNYNPIEHDDLLLRDVVADSLAFAQNTSRILTEYSLEKTEMIEPGLGKMLGNVQTRPFWEVVGNMNSTIGSMLSEVEKEIRACRK